MASPKDASFSALVRKRQLGIVTILAGMLRPCSLVAACSNFLSSASSHQRSQKWGEDLSLVSGLGVPDAQHHRQAFVMQDSEKSWACAMHWTDHGFYIGIRF